MMERTSRITRKTKETQITVVLSLDGSGEVSVSSGVPFFDHMLTAMAIHGQFDLQIEANGDLAVDPHHTVEDVGITLGQAFRAAIGEGKGIARFASLHAPMDDALVLAALDISGRPYLHYGLSIPPQVVGTFATELGEEFFRAFVTHAGVTLHLVQLHGRNAHHVLEAAFKGTGVVLHRGTLIIGSSVPSTKGVL